MALSERIGRWRAAGEDVVFRSRRIHTHRQAGDGPLLVMLHGFPTCSYDWRHVLELERDRAALAFDFLGFGLSDKPRDHVYTLGWQADLTEHLIGERADGPVFLVAHDMGTSGATELMARELEGTLQVNVAGALLFNGGIVLSLASPTVAQRLLRSTAGAMFARMSTKRVFRQQLGSVFSEAHPLRREEADAQWELMTHADGHRLTHRLIHYMDERERLTERWHGAFAQWPKPLSLAWGICDPVATPAVLAALRELRPGVRVTELADLGHYPQLEASLRLAAALEDALAGS